MCFFLCCGLFSCLSALLMGFWFAGMALAMAGSRVGREAVGCSRVFGG